MKKLFLVCTMTLIWTLGLMISEAKAQIAYGISIVRYNAPTRYMDGYSGTALDYWAGIYYDPVVEGTLYRSDDPEVSLSEGYNEGYANSIPAEVYLFSTNYVEGKTYCTYSTHWIRAYYYHPANVRWFDPYRYSSFIYTGGNTFPGYPFSNYYYTSRRYRLGATQACIRIPFPSTPTPTPTGTPTPTITPTPSPTPCPVSAVCEALSLAINTSHTLVMPEGVQGERAGKARITACVTNAGDESPVANKTVDFRTVIRSNQTDSGGHIDSLHTGLRPLGKLDKTRGTTDSSGCVASNFTPSHIAGVVGVNASIPNISVGVDILVGLPNLVYLFDGTNYTRIGVTSSHPSSHWGTQAAVDALPLIADDYKTQFYGNNPIPDNQKVAYNDISLPYGGKFDINKKWTSVGAHAEHRKGINCDTRSSNIPENRWVELNRIFRERGSTRTNNETGTDAPHWHLRFEFGSPQSTSTRTPHSFVEDAWWGGLERESTQAEWENWHTQIVEAKAQGSAQLLAKAKVLEQTVFGGSPYLTIQKTDEEFIEAVFWSHLYREPTEAEILSWKSYLGNLPPSYAIRRRRMNLIHQMQATAEFEQVVLSLVDEPLPPTP